MFYLLGLARMSITWAPPSPEVANWLGFLGENMMEC